MLRVQINCLYQISTTKQPKDVDKSINTKTKNNFRLILRTFCDRIRQRCSTQHGWWIRILTPREDINSVQPKTLISFSYTRQKKSNKTSDRRSRRTLSMSINLYLQPIPSIIFIIDACMLTKIELYSIMFTLNVKIYKGEEMWGAFVHHIRANPQKKYLSTWTMELFTDEKRSKINILTQEPNLSRTIRRIYAMSTSLLIPAFVLPTDVSTIHWAIINRIIHRTTLKLRTKMNFIGCSFNRNPIPSLGLFKVKLFHLPPPRNDNYHKTNIFLLRSSNLTWVFSSPSIW